MYEEKEKSAPPIDILIDIIIGLLEGSTSFTRTIANQSFAMLTPLMTDSTIGLILAVNTTSEVLEVITYAPVAT